jgi:hypothetical protein
VPFSREPSHTVFDEALLRHFGSLQYDFRVRVAQDVDIVLFSPQREHGLVILTPKLRG